MPFDHENGDLTCDGFDLGELAEKYGTPLYVYSGGTLRSNIRRLREGFADLDPLIAYSVKANSNLAILRLAVKEGCGLDIVSGGELERAVRAGAPPDKIIFAGVGKSRDEIAAALDANIAMFNAESTSEIATIDAVAQEKGVRARIALRVNPHVEVDTHHFITTGTDENKFGIDITLLDKAIAAVKAAKQIDLVALHGHIGSQILDAAPYGEAVTKIGGVLERLRSEGHPITHVNIGGGHGIAYERGQQALDPKAVAEAVRPTVKRLGVKVIVEPGRSLAGPAGALLTRVMIVKHGVKKTFVIVDAGMNDLIRPPLYDAHHHIEPVSKRGRMNKTAEVDVVGPVCESTDFFAKARTLPLPAVGDLLAIRDAGAYGFCMASNYNTRPRPAEVLVLDKAAHLIRRRDTIEDILAPETIPLDLK